MPQRRQLLKTSVAMIGCLTAVAPAHADTLAGTFVSNIAQVRATINGVPTTIASNRADIQIAELLDLRLALLTGAVTVPMGRLGGVPFSITNAGNGHEAFALSARVDGIDAPIEGYAIDVNGDGIYDPAVDTLLDASNVTPKLAPGAPLRLLALVRGKTAGTSGRFTVIASAVTGKGRPGSDYAGQGDAGSDAVVGKTTATSEASLTISVGAGGDASNVSLIKSQSVVAPNGSSDAVRGAVVTYTIDARFGGGGTVPAVRLADAIPDRVTYVPGSMRLDGAVLTDGVDGDAGTFDGASVRVALGDVAAPSTHSIQFQVKIK